MKFTEPHWFDIAIVVICVPLCIIAAIGWYRRHSLWEDDKRLDRLHGGKTPETIEREKAADLWRWKKGKK